MEAAFEKIFYISSELLRMQEFWEVTNKVHILAKFTEKNCSIQDFFSKIKEVIFDKELSYDKRRLFFIDVCSSNMSVFNAMFQLHHKGKENLNKIKLICEDPTSILQRQLSRNEELKRLITEKYRIQKRILSDVEDLFLKKIIIILVFLLFLGYLKQKKWSLN